MSIPRLHHVTLLVDDLTSAQDFYVRELGLSVIHKAGLDYPGLFLRINDRQELHLAALPDRGSSYRGHCCLRLPNWAELVFRMRALNALDTEAWGFMRELPGGVLQAYARDPAGNLVELCSLPEERDRIDPNIFLLPEYGDGPFYLAADRLSQSAADRELARRSVRNFAEIIATLGHRGVGPEAVFRRSNLIGARIDLAAENPFFNGAVVPLGQEPPDHPSFSLPYGLWTIEDRVAGREELKDWRTPALGLWLTDETLDFGAPDPSVLAPSYTELAAINERAYDDYGTFSSLLAAFSDPRMKSYGFEEGDQFVCVALTLTLGDDLGIHYVATEVGYRRRGLAGRLLRHILAEAKQAGLRSSTLQASPDGLRLYQQLGYRPLTTLKVFTEPNRLE